ncbi:MAG: hypothetical protein QW763_04495 [Archaeoglobaceae archaeon]
MQEKIDEERRRYVELLQKSVEVIVEKLRDKVERISLIGSYPRRADLFTDLDVLIVMKTEKNFLERVREIYSLLSLPVDADIICYTPENLRKMKNSSFLRKALENEVVLYERFSQRR